MTIQRYDTEYLDDAPLEDHPGGKYVMHSDYISLEDRCMVLESALYDISKLPYCDSHMCRQIARDALADIKGE